MLLQVKQQNKERFISVSCLTSSVNRKLETLPVLTHQLERKRAAHLTGSFWRHIKKALKEINSHLGKYGRTVNVNSVDVFFRFNFMVT